MMSFFKIITLRLLLKNIEDLNFNCVIGIFRSCCSSGVFLTVIKKQYNAYIMYDLFNTLQEDGNKFMALAAELNSKVDRKVEELDEKLLREFASQASGDLCPMQAVIGGMAAQEVMKVS